MARLIVEAAAEPNDVLPGTTSVANIHVSVTDDTGTPITQFATFTLHNLTVSAGRDIELKNVANHPVGTGFYRLQVGPMGTNSWVSGVYVIGISVSRTRGRFLPWFYPRDYGQTLAPIAIPNATP